MNTELKRYVCPRCEVYFLRAGSLWQDLGLKT